MVLRTGGVQGKQKGEVMGAPFSSLSSYVNRAGNGCGIFTLCKNTHHLSLCRKETSPWKKETSLTN